ncbi:secretion protein [Planctomycetia bacterium]|nr:secretion protein [Planctomycetia bacterium]
MWASVVLSGGLFIGCSTSEKKLSYFGDTDLQHYKDAVTSIDYPAVNQETPDEVSFTDEPRRIRNPRKDEIWNLGLEEALHTALANNEIIRDNGQFLSPGNRLLSNPDFVQSVYDPALQDTSTLFGQNGVEAALSEFDAQFTANMLYGRSQSISENSSFGGISNGETLGTHAGDARFGLSKIFANGGQASIQHNVLYQDFNQNSGGNPRLFQSYFANNPSATQNAGIPGIEIDYRQPLWAGGGTRFTRIAGPISRRPTLQNVPQVNQGVVISRIRTDIALADFEQATIGLVKDVEDVYWELYLAYRAYDTDITARNSFLHTWREVKAKTDQGLEGGSAADEAQARDSYFDARAASENSLSNVYNTEGRLRRLLGLPVNDGRIVRPADEPTTAEFLPNWRTSLVEALTRRVELRKQKWNIKSLEFQLEAAKSLTNPRLDLVSRFQVNGFGDQLFGKSNDGPQGVGAAPFPSQTTASFYENLLNGNQTGYGIGVEYSMPIGFRAAHSQVRNLELRLAKARAALGAQEFEVSHELANAFRQADTTFQTAQTYFNRRRAAERRVQANEAQYRAGKGSVDLLLRAQVSLATAEKAYYQAVVGYNRAILDMKFRKGTLMEDHNVFLSESLSHPEAYTQAVRHAWARSHAFDANHLDTQPEEFATDESDPVELGPTVYSSSLGSGLTQPPAPEPVPSVELPATELKPLPKPEPIPEPAAPAPPVKKEFSDSGAAHSHKPSQVQPATSQSPFVPATETSIEPIEFQAESSDRQPAIRETRSSDDALQESISNSRQPTSKVLEIDDESDEDDEVAADRFENPLRR